MQKIQIRIMTSVLLLLLCGAMARAQEEFNPSNPPDPYLKYKIVAVATEGNYTSGSGQYVTGTQVTLNTSAANTNYKFKYWTKDGVQYTTDEQFTYTVEASNVRFVAVYEFSPENPSDPQSSNEYRLYMIPSPEGCCSFNYTSGAKVECGENITVTASANQGYVFDGWYDESNNKVSETQSYNFIMPEATKTLTARYTYNPSTPNDPASNMESEDWLQRGDIDGDGELSVTDVVFTSNYIMTPTGVNEKRYDMDRDGEVTVTDLVLLVNKIMSNE